MTEAITVMTLPPEEMPEFGLFGKDGVVAYSRREILLREGLRPRWRRYVLWHEWVHWRIERKYGSVARPLHALFDSLSPFISVIMIRRLSS